MAATADCLTEVDAIIGANPIRRVTCNPTGGGFRRIVGIRPDPDSRVGYPSIPSPHDVTNVSDKINYTVTDTVVSNHSTDHSL